MTCLRIRPRLLRQTHLQVLVAAMDAVQDRLADRRVMDAAERFFQRTFADTKTVSRYLQDQDAHSQFYPWLLWDAALVEPDNPAVERMGETLLLPCHGVRADVVKALLRTPPDVFQVVRSTDRQTTLERLSDGALFGVDEPVLPTVLQPKEILVARVLDLGDYTLIDAVHACLPATARRGLVRASRRVEALPMEERLPILLRAADRAMIRVLKRDRQLTAPDGSAVMRVSTVLHVQDAAQVRTALDALANETQLTATGPHTWRVTSAALGPVGSSVRLHTQPGRPRLTVTTSSLKRSKALAAALMARLPALKPGVSILRNLTSLMDQDERSAYELRQLAQAWIEEYLHNFEDTPQGPLNNLTPRQAMTTTRGQRLVRELLATLGHLGDSAGAGVQPRLAHVWTELAP